MCGIAGIIIHHKSRFHPLHMLEQMNQLQHHRGPDGEGYVAIGTDGSFTFLRGQNTPAIPPHFPFYPSDHIREYAPEQRIFMAHKRLSIRELSAAGHQPMCNHTREVCIVYNGEIYNHLELKENITTEEPYWGQSDTEILLKSYLQWGEECPEQLNGIFAFTLYDHRKQLLFGSRDRNGVKPLYYIHHPDYFAWASEPKALMPLLKEPRIHHGSAFDYLVNAKIDVTEHDLIAEITALKPGYKFTYHPSNHSLQLSPIQKKPLPPSPLTLKEAIDKTRLQIHQAVKRQLVSDVPIGFSLSGGIDSAVLIAEAAGMLPGDSIPLFSSNSGVQGVDEGHYQRMMAEMVNGKWTAISVSIEAFPEHASALIQAQDAPLLGFNNFAHHCLLQEVKKQGIKVLFNGQGADELFAGYPHHYLSWLLESPIMNAISLITHFHQAQISASLFMKWLGRHLVQQLLPHDRLIAMARRRKPWLTYLNQEFLHEHMQQIQAVHSFPNRLHLALEQDYYGQKLREMLHWEDRVTMMHSVEARNPFADDTSLAAFAFSLPSSYKIAKGYSKYVLRKAYATSLPQEICFRKDKKGYTMPDFVWTTQMAPFFLSCISDYKGQLLNKKAVLKDFKHLVHSPQAEIRSFVFRLANWCMYENITKATT